MARGVRIGRRRRHAPQEEVHLVTAARRSRYDDIAERQRRYLTKMGIRTVCVVVAFFAPLPMWARGLAIVAAVVLPWVSVTSANIGPLPDPQARPYHDTVRELPPPE
jgi:Protein of unknown function (DUF3099)